MLTEKLTDKDRTRIMDEADKLNFSGGTWNGWLMGCQYATEYERKRAQPIVEELAKVQHSLAINGFSNWAKRIGEVLEKYQEDAE